MIKNIKLQFGSNSQSEQLEIETTPVTVFVGPNNSGKSKLLTEIHQYCRSGAKNQDFKLIDDIIFHGLENSFLDDEISKNTLTPNMNEVVQEGQILFGNGIIRNLVLNTFPNQILSNPNRDKRSYCNYYLSYNTLKLDALNRIKLINEQPLGDLQRVPSNNLAILFKDNDKRKETRRIIYEAFNSYFVLDPTNVGKIRIRFSKTEPENEALEKGLHKAAVDFYSKALDISQMSDGVKAFTGIITSIIAGNPRVTLLDEPEAFLHPSLSFKLGKEVSNSAKIETNRLFVSTHNSNFLMGCVQSGAPINIVRLTYSNEVGTARLLDKNKIESLMKDPLLRSTGVLNALFYKYVIVTEGASDRAFYQEINERLLEFCPEKAIHNCLFINAVGKDTIWKIVKPLRELGIPAVGIYDIDILKNEGSNWTNALGAAFLPEINKTSLGQTRSSIKAKFAAIKNNTGKDMKSDGGINILSVEDKEAADNLFNQLEEYGLFTVRKGEVEHWLSTLGVQAHKSVWISKMFERMGSDSSMEGYVKPSVDDVWAFMESINAWMKNENRKGIPK